MAVILNSSTEVEFEGVLLPPMSGNVYLYDDIVERFVCLMT